MFSKLNAKINLDTMVANKINEGTSVNGHINAVTDIRIDGIITGNITCSSKVVIGSKAQITGNIQCNDLTIEGRVKGNIEVLETLYFKSNAQFEGDVKYKKLIVEEGATISGSLTNATIPNKDSKQTQLNGHTEQAELTKIQHVE